MHVSEPELLINPGTERVDGALPPSRSATAAVVQPNGLEPGVKRRIVRNVIWNWAGVATEVLTAFFLTPFLIRRLGDSAYGTWIVIGALAGYISVLDFGLRGSVGRFVAFYRARNDSLGLCRTLSSAGAALVVLGMAVGLLTCALAPSVLHMTGVPESARHEAWVALLLLGLHLVAWFPLRIFDAALWGFQRFDWLNMIDISVTACRALLSATVVARGYGLVGLAAVTLTATLLTGTCKAWLTFCEGRPLHIGGSFVTRPALFELFGYGTWGFVISIAQMARLHISPIGVAHSLGVAVVAPFSIATRLVGIVGAVRVAGAGVFTPVATAHFATTDERGQMALYRVGTSISLAFAIHSFVMLALLGKPFLVLWLGERFAIAAQPLTILAAGEILPGAAEFATLTMLAMARHRALAWRGVAELLIGLALGLWMSRYWGLAGFCAGLALAAGLIRGIGTLLIARTVIQIPLMPKLRSFVGTDALLSAPAVLIAAVCIGRPPHSWLDLVLVTALYVSACAACTALWHNTAYRPEVP